MPMSAIDQSYLKRNNQSDLMNSKNRTSNDKERKVNSMISPRMNEIIEKNKDVLKNIVFCSDIANQLIMDQES
jgi:hypothetical protein